MITADTIIESMKGYVESKTPIPPGLWMDAAAKLNAFLGDEADKLYSLQQAVAIMSITLLDKGETSAATKIRIQATDEYRNMKIQKAKISQIEEFIRIAKVQARLRDTELRGF